MTKKPIFFSLLSLVILASISLPVVFYLFNSGDFYGREVSVKAPEFELLKTNNQTHQLAEHKGKFVFLYFGYLNCDDVCHNQVGVMFNINHQTDNQDLDFIFVTMDPKRDSNEMLNDYFNQFGKNFTALTAKNMQQVQKIAVQYKAPFFATGSTQAERDYEIAHPGSIFLIDPKGDIRVVYQNQYLRYDMIIEDLKILRAELREALKTNLHAESNTKFSADLQSTKIDRNGDNHDG